MSPPVELKILKTVDIVESLLVSIARDTLTSVVDDTSQPNQAAVYTR